MSIVFNIPDMTCGHCVQTITDAIKVRFPEAQVEADVSTHMLRIEGAEDQAVIEDLIKEEGYTPTAA